MRLREDGFQFETTSMDHSPESVCSLRKVGARRGDAACAHESSATTSSDERFMKWMISQRRRKERLFHRDTHTHTHTL